MGFGLLFAGYFITYFMALTKYAVVFRFLGYSLISYSLLKLSEYNRRFMYAAVSAVVLIFITAFSGILELTSFLANNMVIASDPLRNISSEVVLNVDTVLVFLFHALLLFAINSIAKETGISKISASAIRNFVFISLYFVLSVLRFLPLSIQESYSKNMGLPLLILYFVWLILDLSLIFSCYAKICDQNDLEMARKPSKFEFVNKLRAEMDERQERARKSSEEYRKNKQLNKKRKK